jgi:hypothetical protein
MVIAYRETTTEGTESLGLCEGPFLQVGNLSVPEDESPSFEFCVWKRTIDPCFDNGTGRFEGVIASRDGERPFERCFDNRTGRIRSVIVRSPASGTYSFPGWISGHGGSFSSEDGRVDFAVDLNMNSSFLDVLFFGRARPTCVFRATASDISEGRKSVGFEKSPEGISRGLTESRQFARWGESVGALRETSPEAMGSTDVWIGAGITLAALLIVIVVIILLLRCRHCSLNPATDAMSVDRKIPGKLAQDLSEGAMGVLL